ncbi:MAG: DUF86 domain-containing protein [Bacteroidetes bacterium]|nr:DUF86 domain-containing protein [Bacteroidota bacterium]MBL7105120.1 DUF86 domain-containing protein [Bacteroidales bacterium]
MHDKPGDRARMLHIIDAIQEIEFYNSNANFEKFKKTSIIRFASIKQLEIIGEATNRISDEIKTLYPNIQWRRIVGLRNILIHEYFGVDAKVVWDIIQNDIPILKKGIKVILENI